MTEKITITVQEGKLRGIKESSVYSGVEFYSFYGVPYGEPPINNLRFKDPKPVKPWNNIYEATTKKPGCVQYSLRVFAFLGNEDCLYNNIYIPQIPVKGEPLKPVIVNIHPGGFMFGTPNRDQYGSVEFIMNLDVIYICPCFRLHILGFLNLGLKECSGNQSIKDVLLSLRWIKRNIKAFGGDPENITVLGSSSGATYIHALMVSPAAKGLFHKAVMMGGYLYLPVLPFEETNHRHAYDIAKPLGFTGTLDDKRALLLFLKKIPPQVLVESQRKCAKDYQKKIAPILPIGIFHVTIDGGLILPEPPRNMIQSMSRIPLMVGFCERESIMGFTKGHLRQETEEHFLTSIRQNCWGWGHNLGDKDIEYIHQSIKSFYTEGKSLEDACLSLKVDIQTDIMLSDVYDTLIDVIAEDLPSSVFVYKFDFDGKVPTTKNMFRDAYNEELTGTYHGCDYSYWACFGFPGDDETQQIMEYFTKLIANFARTGNPNSEDIPIEWKPTTPENPCYLSINNPLKMVDGKLNNDRMEHWSSVKRHLQNK